MNIRQKIEQVKNVLLQQSRTSFRQLLQTASNRTEIIVTFLAVLELVKQRNVMVAQETLYADVAIATIGNTSAE